MAELVLIYDNVTGGFISKQAGADHIANAAIVSAKVASGAIGAPHLAAAAILSANIASGAIGSSHLGYSPTAGALLSGDHATLLHLSGQIGANVLATPHFANQGIVSASVGAGILATPHFQNQGILSASYGAGVIGTPHLANQGIVSALIAAGIIGAPHIAAGGILSGQVGAGQLSDIHFVDGAIVSSKVGAGVLGGAHFANASILSAQIASGIIGQTHLGPDSVQSGHIGSGTQDLGIIAQRRPWQELGQVIISGGWFGEPMTVPIISGMAVLEVVAAMKENTATAGDAQLLCQFNGLSGNALYNHSWLVLGGSYTQQTWMSSRFFPIIPDRVARRALGRATIHCLGGDDRHSFFSETTSFQSGAILSAQFETVIMGGWYDDAILISGLTFWCLSGDWLSGSVVKVFGAQI